MGLDHLLLRTENGLGIAILRLDKLYAAHCLLIVVKVANAILTKNECQKLGVRSVGFSSRLLIGPSLI